MIRNIPGAVTPRVSELAQSKEATPAEVQTAQELAMRQVYLDAMGDNAGLKELRDEQSRQVQELKQRSGPAYEIFLVSSRPKLVAAAAAFQEVMAALAPIPSGALRVDAEWARAQAEAAVKTIMAGGLQSSVSYDKDPPKTLAKLARCCDTFQLEAMLRRLAQVSPGNRGELDALAQRAAALRQDIVGLRDQVAAEIARAKQRVFPQVELRAQQAIAAVEVALKVDRLAPRQIFPMAIELLETMPDRLRAALARGEPAEVTRLVDKAAEELAQYAASDFVAKIVADKGLQGIDVAALRRLEQSKPMNLAEDTLKNLPASLGAAAGAVDAKISAWRDDWYTLARRHASRDDFEADLVALRLQGEVVRQEMGRTGNNKELAAALLVLGQTGRQVAMEWPKSAKDKSEAKDKAISELFEAVSNDQLAEKLAASPGRSAAQQEHLEVVVAQVMALTAGQPT